MRLIIASTATADDDNDSNDDATGIHLKEN